MSDSKRERVWAHDLLRQGGAWLGAARSWLQHKRTTKGVHGDQVTWGDENAIFALSARAVEEVAAEAAAAAFNEERERIVAAAISYDGVTFSVPAPGRHHDVAHAMVRMNLGTHAQREQGFLTSTGRFVNRYKAWRIAESAGQMIMQSGPVGTLFSEDVW